jgi:hypothetical protein
MGEMMQYTIHRSAAPLGSPSGDWNGPVWSACETLEIGNFNWEEREDSGHHPHTQARVTYDESYVGLIFRVEDRYVRAVAEKFQDSVCSDSCVEFFVSPIPDLPAYFNFEVNCGGTMLVRRMASAAEREEGKESIPLTDAEWESIPVATSLPSIVEPELTEPTTWTLEYHLPVALFISYFGVSAPAAGTVWKANFYKCGDLTSHPHWGSWAPVGLPAPSFHVPEFFQPIVFA